MLVFMYAAAVSGILHSIIEQVPAVGAALNRRTGKRSVEWVMYGRLHSHYVGEGVAVSAVLCMGGIALVGLEHAAEANASRLVILSAMLAALSITAYAVFADYKMLP